MARATSLEVCARVGGRAGVFRDLRQARHVNRVLGKLRALERCHKLTSEQAAEVRSLLGWDAELEIIEVRPAAPLRGNGLDGFFSSTLRREYLEAGRRAAKHALARVRS